MYPQRDGSIHTTSPQEQLAVGAVSFGSIDPDIIRRDTKLHDGVKCAKPKQNTTRHEMC